MRAAGAATTSDDGKFRHVEAVGSSDLLAGAAVVTAARTSGTNSTLKDAHAVRAVVDGPPFAAQGPGGCDP